MRSFSLNPIVSDTQCSKCLASKQLLKISDEIKLSSDLLDWSSVVQLVHSLLHDRSCYHPCARPSMSVTCSITLHQTFSSSRLHYSSSIHHSGVSFRPFLSRHCQETALSRSGMIRRPRLNFWEIEVNYSIDLERFTQTTCSRSANSIVL